MPLPSLPEMTLRAPAAVPPTVIFVAVDDRVAGIVQQLPLLQVLMGQLGGDVAEILGGQGSEQTVLQGM